MIVSGSPASPGWSCTAGGLGSLTRLILPSESTRYKPVARRCSRAPSGPRRCSPGSRPPTAASGPAGEALTRSALGLGLVAGRRRRGRCGGPWGAGSSTTEAVRRSSAGAATGCACGRTMTIPNANAAPTRTTIPAMMMMSRGGNRTARSPTRGPPDRPPGRQDHRSARPPGPPGPPGRGRTAGSAGRAGSRAAARRAPLGADPAVGHPAGTGPEVPVVAAGHPDRAGAADRVGRGRRPAEVAGGRAGRRRGRRAESDRGCRCYLAGSQRPGGQRGRWPPGAPGMAGGSAFRAVAMVSSVSVCGVK